MITAQKYLNLDLSIINLSASIISKLKKDNLLQYDELLGALVSSHGVKAKAIFPYTLNFLFLLDKISFVPEFDAFQLNSNTYSNDETLEVSVKINRITSL